MKKNILGLLLIISTFHTHTSPLRFLAKASVLSAAAIGIKGAFIVREKGPLTNEMTFEQIKNSLENKRNFWNYFGFARRLFKPEQQPTMNRLVLQENIDGSRFVLDRDSCLFFKNNGYFRHTNKDGLVQEQVLWVSGPIAKSDIAVGVGAAVAAVSFLSLSGPGFLGGFLIGSML